MACILQVQQVSEHYLHLCVAIFRLDPKIYVFLSDSEIRTHDRIELISKRPLETIVSGAGEAKFILSLAFFTTFGANN